MTQRNKRRQALELRRSQVGFRGLNAFLTPFLFFCLSASTPLGKAHCLTGDLILQSTQEPTGAGKEKDIHALEPGKPIRRELAGGQRHTYQTRLDPNQFLKVVVEQKGIDVVAQASGPDGKQILEVDSESRSQGREEISLVAEAAGAFQLIVRPKQNGAPAGSYEIRIEELRVATDTDRALHDARKQFEESLKLRDADKLDEALTFAERALEIRERLLGTEHPDVAASIDNLASIYTGNAEYVKAEPLYRRALAIREKALGKDHPETAKSLNNLAEVYRIQGKYLEAEPLYKRALEIQEKALGKDHLEIAESLNNLGALYYSQGKYVETEPLFRRAFEIREKALGKDHSDTAQSLANLAVLYSEQGKVVEAEPLYKRALDIFEKALGKDHPYTAGSLNNLALLYYSQGKYVEAEPLYNRALDITEKALGKDHPNTAIGLSNLAEVYRAQGKYGEAEPLYNRALDIREKALGKDHPNTAIGLSNLAELYRAQRKYEEAEPLFRGALDIYEKALGKGHPNTAASLNNLGLLYRMQGRYGEAEPLYRRALEIREMALGKDHPDTAISLNSLAALYTATGDLVQAVKLQSLANAASERNLARNLVIGSERQKLAYLATLSEQTDRTISLHLNSAPDDPAAGALAATLILQRKGRALDATSQNLNALRSRFNAEDQALLDRLTETRSQLARLVLGGPQKMTAEQYQARIKDLEDQADKDEADISRRSDEFRAQSLPVTLEAVRAAIPSDSALIEFASYRPFNAKATRGDEAYGQPRYVAYVLRHEGEIEWKELGEAKAIDTAIAALRKALRDPLRLQVARESRGGPLVVAAPDFGRRSQVEAARLGKQEKDASGGEVKAESARSAIKELFFPPLPYAEREGEALRELLPDTTLLTKGQATKAALSQVRSPKLLHIATHSFFLDDQQLTSAGERGARALIDDPERTLQRLEQSGVRIESPLLRSGLALAGANEHKEDDNGILTALEVTGLNLWGTKLVALSACDTGVGEVKNGDGVHGLRRALVLAGAETQVMSLWAVSDKATRELMVAYYGRLKQGQGRGEALRRGQLEMLKNVNRRHPYYWASFIQSGEWANLEGKR